MQTGFKILMSRKKNKRININEGNKVLFLRFSAISWFSVFSHILLLCTLIGFIVIFWWCFTLLTFISWQNGIFINMNMKCTREKNAQAILQMHFEIIISSEWESCIAWFIASFGWFIPTSVRMRIRSHQLFDIFFFPHANNFHSNAPIKPIFLLFFCSSPPLSLSVSVSIPLKPMNIILFSHFLLTVFNSRFTWAFFYCGYLHLYEKFKWIKTRWFKIYYNLS